MNEMLRPEDIEELLGAYALDAVDPDERYAVEQYLATNPRARAEVQQHREVATMLAFSGAPAPEGVWDRIASAIDGLAPAPGPELARVLPRPDAALSSGAVLTGAPAAHPNAADARRSASVVPLARRRHAGRWLAGFAAAAAAVVIAVLGVAVVRRGNELDQLRAAAVGGALNQGYGQAMADPTADKVVLLSTDGRSKAQAVVEPNGHGFLAAGELPALPDGRVYQLWGVVDGKVISLAVMGSRPDLTTFTVDGGKLSALVITEEEPGGVPVSKQPAALKGTLS